MIWFDWKFMRTQTITSSDVRFHFSMTMFQKSEHSLHYTSYNGCRWGRAFMINGDAGLINSFQSTCSISIESSWAPLWSLKIDVKDFVFDFDKYTFPYCKCLSHQHAWIMKRAEVATRLAWTNHSVLVFYPLVEYSEAPEISIIIEISKVLNRNEEM